MEVPAEYLDKSGNNPGQVFAMGNLDSSSKLMHIFFFLVIYFIRYRKN